MLNPKKFTDIKAKTLGDIEKLQLDVVGLFSSHERISLPFIEGKYGVFRPEGTKKEHLQFAPCALCQDR